MSGPKTRARAMLSSCLALTLVTVACGPTELATLRPDEAERLVRTEFPDAEVTVQEISRSGDSLRATAEFNGGDVELAFSAGASGWTLETIELAGVVHTVRALREIAATMATMRALSDALAAYRQDRGSFPMLDDLVGLRELSPDYYPAAGDLEDYWGNAFRYRLQGADYTLRSAGADGQMLTQDDIVLVNAQFVAAGA